MPSNEIKRQFTLGKMEKDKDDRLVEPGAYRDANNIDVARSEGDDSGALQVVRGNKEPVDQEIDWERRENEADGNQEFDQYIELTKPFGETIGVYPYPQEEKVYFFNTGRPVNPNFPDVEQPLQNGVFEYDQVNEVVSPILIETDMGDYEAGGAATQEFIGEIQDTQVWGKASYQSDTNQTDVAFQYLKAPSLDTDDFAIVQLTCNSSTVIERDADDLPVCRTGGACDGAICDCSSGGDCQETILFFEAAGGNYVCRIGGIPSGDVCDCSGAGTGDCDFVQLACGVEGGLSRTEEDCQSQPGAINDDLNYEEKSNMILEYDSEEFPEQQWIIAPSPDTTIQYQTIVQSDVDDPRCTVDPDRDNPIGQLKYTLNGNGAELQPEEFCDPRCPIFVPDGCVPTDQNNQCYPEYCLLTPVLDSLFNTILTDQAIETNRTRTITMTGVEGVGDGEIITATLKRLVPQATTLGAGFNPGTNQYDFTAPEDNGRGVFTPDDVVIVRGMDALDFQQLDQILGNVGLASREVGYTYRVARNGNLSWVPNSDDVFQAFGDPNTDTNEILANLNPNDSQIPAGGAEAESLTFNVEVDRQQEFEINADDESDDVHDPNSDRYIDDNTREP